MADKLQFELVSPEKLLLSEPVGMVIVPGTEGNFGVLPGHALFISTVRPGVIDVYEDNTVSERIFVAGGFAEVTPERCTVLADEALPLSSIDRAAVEAEAKTLDSTVTGLKDQAARLSGAERDEAQAKLRNAERQLAVAAAKLAAIGAVH
ncbi:MAG TPA: ATP synthase F1 subunit epsilon [Stellaceae bacterium]|nr:ATP synthase F1 subunit epsilon [Stellaceae bacterium]